MSWIAVDVDLWAHPKMSALPNDTARYGWLVVLSQAKSQKPAGTFASEKHFKEVMGRFGRYMNDYFGARLLFTDAEGRVAINDWQKHQWAWTKQRQREDKKRTSTGHLQDTHVHVQGQGSFRTPVAPLDETPYVLLTEEEKAQARQKATDELNAITKARLGVQ